jgi:hypothetical protein
MICTQIARDFTGRKNGAEVEKLAVTAA